MAEQSVTLSDVGEGVAEAELIEWHVAVGDAVTEDQLLAVVMTDKAAVEIPSSVLGRVIHLAAQVGDVVAVGAELLRLETQSTNRETNEPASSNAVGQNGDKTSSQTSIKAATHAQSNVNPPSSATSPGSPTDLKPLAAPSVRLRARKAGIDLKQMQGSGPAGRITHEDIDRYNEDESNRPASNERSPDTSVEKIPIRGIRRKIAQKMSLAKSRIPHITIVEEIDVHNLELLRSELNQKHAETRVKLTLLPFVMKAIVEAVREQPVINAHYDDDTETLSQFGGVHMGIATQTANGLIVPVIRHCEINGLWENAKELTRLAEAARQGSAKREELTGSTITITSLGPLGAIATTPIINHPEVAIIGINKMAIRPHWDGQQFVPRKMLNLSCSFDHRVVDGWDAALLVQQLKTSLESPAMLFVEN